MNKRHIMKRLLLGISSFMFIEMVLPMHTKATDYMTYSTDDYTISHQADVTYAGTQEVKITTTNDNLTQYYGEAENLCVKGVLVRGTEIDTAQELKDLINSSANTAYTVANAANPSSASRELSTEIIYEMLRDTDRTDLTDITVDDEVIEDYKNDRSGEIWNNYAYPRAATIVTMKDALYVNGPIVQDNYIYDAFRDEYGPDVDVSYIGLLFNIKR